MKSILRGTLSFLLLVGSTSLFANTKTGDCILSDKYRSELALLSRDLVLGESSIGPNETLLKISKLDKALQIHFQRCLHELSVNPSFACAVTANARRHIQETSLKDKISNMGYRYAADQVHLENVLRFSSPLCPIIFGV